MDKGDVIWAYELSSSAVQANLVAWLEVPALCNVAVAVSALEAAALQAGDMAAALAVTQRAQGYGFSGAARMRPTRAGGGLSIEVSFQSEEEEVLSTRALAALGPAPAEGPDSRELDAWKASRARIMSRARAREATGLPPCHAEAITSGHCAGGAPEEDQGLRDLVARALTRARRDTQNNMLALICGATKPWPLRSDLHRLSRSAAMKETAKYARVDIARMIGYPPLRAVCSQPQSAELEVELFLDAQPERGDWWELRTPAERAILGELRGRAQPWELSLEDAIWEHKTCAVPLVWEKARGPALSANLRGAMGCCPTWRLGLGMKRTYFMVCDVGCKEKVMNQDSTGK